MLGSAQLIPGSPSSSGPLSPAPQIPPVTSPSSSSSSALLLDGAGWVDGRAPWEISQLPPRPPSGSFLGGLPSSHPSVKASTPEITPRAGRCPRGPARCRGSGSSPGGSPRRSNRRLGSHLGGAASGIRIGVLHFGFCISHLAGCAGRSAAECWWVGLHLAFYIWDFAFAIWDVPLGTLHFASRVLYLTNSRGTRRVLNCSGPVSSMTSRGDLHAFTKNPGSGSSRIPPAHKKTILRHRLLRDRTAIGALAASCAGCAVHEGAGCCNAFS